MHFTAGRVIMLAIKRLIDIVGAATGLFLLSPILAVVALQVRFRLGSPILFRQTRSGLNGTPFTVLKFRTMKDPSPGLMRDEDRLTPLGRMLRKTSLDELPSLINILKGEMSLVGPRPLMADYLDRYTPQQARRLLMRPGLTGLAQVSGRNALGWDERFRLDTLYVDTWSLWLDITIVLRTILVVLGGEGISAEGHATMPVFTGSDQRTPETEGPENKSADL